LEERVANRVFSAILVLATAIPSLAVAQGQNIGTALYGKLAGRTICFAPVGCGTYQAEGTYTHTDGSVGRWSAVGPKTIRIRFTNGYVRTDTYNFNGNSVELINGKNGKHIPGAIR
jgi:hypothetical protein